MAEFFLDWDTGGVSPHIRYHRGDGKVIDQPSTEEPIHPGVWSVQWMNPEPMHSIEIATRHLLPRCYRQSLMTYASGWLNPSPCGRCIDAPSVIARKP